MLNSNNFTGPLPTSFSNFTSLQLLNISDNQLSGSLPDTLPPTMTFIGASGN